MGSVIWIFQTELYEILSVTLPLWPAACGSGSNPALQEEVQGIGLWFPPGVLPQVHEEFLSSHTVGSLAHVTLWANPAPPITGPTGAYIWQGFPIHTLCTSPWLWLRLGFSELFSSAEQHHKLLIMGTQATLWSQSKIGPWSILIWWAELVSSTIWSTQTCN